ncbi:MAG: CBS domain-containing protein [Solirubrobacterales bacterium]
MSASVSEIMDADPVSVSPEVGIERVVELMHENELPGLPVVDDEGLLLGIITESDLLLFDENEDTDPPPSIQVMGGVIYLGSVKHWEERIRKAVAGTAGELMTDEPITVTADASAHDAGHLISEHRHNRLPVVDDEGHLVGMVTRVDVLEALLEDR